MNNVITTLSDEEMTKIKLIDLDKFCNFYVHDFFIWNQLVFQNNVWPSLCAPLNIVPLLPLSFFSIFWPSLFFWEISTFSFSFFDIFPSLRSTKEVTTENMSSNKWKTWPVENSEDVLKIDKKLVTTKRGSCDHFLTNLNFSNPGLDGSEFFFWSILIYGTSKSEFVCEN